MKLKSIAKTIKYTLLLLTVLGINLYSLSASNVSALGVNIVPNPSVETASADGKSPVSWTSNSWGQNTPKFEYKSSGQNGSKSVYVSISNYVDGDAKWHFEPQAVKPGTKYIYSNYYKSSVVTSVYAWVITSTGEDNYIYLGDAAKSSSSWKKLTLAVNTPANASKISILHVLSANGNLTIDTVSLAEGSTPVITNNVPNNSMEQVSDESTSLPLAWTSSKWGTNNASFSYPTSGHTGTRSLKITISSYTSGDAKWFFDYQPAEKGASYQFKDWYKANVVTQIIVSVLKTNGETAYIQLPDAPKSTSWKEYVGNFTMPTDAQSFTVLHLLNKVGNLTVDDYSIAYAASPIVRDGVPNNTLEQSTIDGKSPLAWTNSKWGTNTALFEYLNTGHNGTKSVKVTMSGYTDGDAKWFYDAQPVQPGTLLKFSNYYKSNITTSVVLMFTMADGSTVYQGLPNASPSTEWNMYSSTFEVPQNAVKMTALHLIAGNGYLITDDYAITPYNYAGLQRGMVSITFDDGWEDNYTTVLPKMQEYGYKSTQFYATMYIQAGKEHQIKAFADAGHEIGSHSVNHPDLTKLTPEQLTYELTHSKQVIEGIVGQGVVRNFATPFGAYNDTVLAEIDKYYKSHRSVDVGYNSLDNFNMLNVRVQNILSTTTAQEVDYWVKRALQDNTWLVLVYHRVGQNPGPYDTTPEAFYSHLASIYNAAAPVVTYDQGLDEVQSQL